MFVEEPASILGTVGTYHYKGFSAVPYLPVPTKHLGTRYRVPRYLHPVGRYGTELCFAVAVKEHGQCETLPYRLLVGGGGAVWVQTKATIVHARRSSNKANSVVCKHAVIT